MGKTLIIAEKPSVAKDVAAALGVPRSGDVYENDQLVVSNCIGHLVEIFAPEAEDRNVRPPIIPAVFKLRPIERTASQFKSVKALMARSDISVVANACDAGREGEAIFRLVYELAGCKKKMERLWLQSMTKAGIKSAWTGRQPGAKFDGLADAARSRAEADWLVGINGSRACYQPVGRVMTPTLALVVDRFIANRDFVAKDYFEVFGVFDIASGSFKAKWVQAKGVADPSRPDAQEKRIEDRAIAQAVVDKCKGHHPTSINDESRPTKTAAPFLFDLTSLQREANKRFKFSAQKTLTIAQALYEKHKVTSYPRTDSQRLPEDYVPKCKDILGELKSVPGLGGVAGKPLDNNWVVPNKRIFDDSKITDHFAIIPTGVVPSGLSSDEEKIFGLVAKRFIAIFYPDAEYTSTTRTTIVAGETFRTSGRVLVRAGWLEVAGTTDDDEKTPALPLLAAGETGKTKSIEVVKQQTKPPALYTEATLLTAMETAGKALDEDEYADAMKERGLGTPATRAATIEKLLAEGKSGAYMKRQGNNLVPTDKGIAIIQHLHQKAPKLTSPVLTGEWEYKLLQMEKGGVARSVFMEEIAAFTRELSSTAAGISAPAGRTGGAAAGNVLDIKAACPLCGNKLISDGRVVRHNDGDACEFRVWQTIAGRAMSAAEIDRLLTEKALPELQGFMSPKTKKSFAAGLSLNAETGKIEFVYGVAAVDAACPRCGKKLGVDGRKAVCECGFSIWMTVADVALTPDQLKTLLSEGKTGLINGFKSRAGKDFSAALVFDKATEKVTFDFTGAKNESSGAKSEHKDGQKCPKCKKGKLLYKKTGEGKSFLGCSGFPSCRFFEWA